jgi:hypothetical protein
MELCKGYFAILFTDKRKRNSSQIKRAGEQ